MQFAFDLDSGAVQLPRARSSDPITSHQAAASAKELAKEHHALILRMLRCGPGGADDIAARTCGKLSGHQVNKRLGELGKAGAIRLTGKTVQSTSGRAQREWCLA